ncbi:MAG: hypothetical protein AUJ96_23360 [Armatimonadetes bacterium CG2_30_66_41]|nr:DUF362 domain-containing protein [Armatimonadota bacterium]OIO97322.1 MAG: hypothetical protein AUJ96_23360 [Armatimonadetes bacterium CG2_30_66_41]NCO92437.1 DUF362 domain-containing protein [Armatimonadota bacterium]NCP31571.1 DUF362 domain-containing protein [Armatimonadota bacterium]NCQ32181.1 DUF362 domain-containing protein [Armatimonadota bacterium]
MQTRTPHWSPDPLDRRSFLRLTGAAAGASLVGAGNASAASYGPGAAFLGKVVKYTDPKLLRPSGELDVKQAKSALDECLGALYSVSRGDTVWSKLFSHTDVVGLKVNCLAGQHLSSNPLLVQVVAEGVQSAGVKPENIIIFDMQDAHLAKAGFEYNRGGKGVQCYGTGSDYDSQLTSQGKVVTNLSKILSTTCTAIVNMPILKDHLYTGISAAMKNHFGCIMTPHKYHHPKGGDPFVADNYAIPQIHGKERLILCEALTACFDGGPSPDPSRLSECLFQPNALLVSKDAVALDYVGFRLIEDERKKRGRPSLKEDGRAPMYIVTAAKYGLGIRDFQKTQLLELPKV